MWRLIYVRISNITLGFCHMYTCIDFIHIWVACVLKCVCVWSMKIVMILWESFSLPLCLWTSNWQIISIVYGSVHTWPIGLFKHLRASWLSYNRFPRGSFGDADIQKEKFFHSAWNKCPYGIVKLNNFGSRQVLGKLERSLGVTGRDVTPVVQLQPSSTPYMVLQCSCAAVNCPGPPQTAVFQRWVHETCKQACHQ